MDSRDQALIIVEPIHVDGELIDNPIIKKINLIIEFINKNHYRQQEGNDKDYQKQYPKAALSNDIQLRQQIAFNLRYPANVTEIVYQVRQSLQKKYLSEEEVDQAYEAFRDVIDEFFTFAMFERMTLAHLTAAELAIAGLTIDTLLILLHQARITLQEDEALHKITDKQREILLARERIVNCMRYHKTVFDRNYNKHDKEPFYYSDIILNLLDVIEKITGICFTQEKDNLWPDMSYLHVLPDFPLIKQDKFKTVKQYFAEYVEMPPPGLDKVNSLSDEVRKELNFLETEENQITTNHMIAEESRSGGWGCFPFFWLQPTGKNKSVEQAPRKKAKMPRAAEYATLDDVIRLLSSFNDKEEEQLAKLKLQDELRKDVIDLQQKLQGRIDVLMQPSCFSFFWRGELRKKLAKKAALDHVLDTATLEELGQCAYNELHGPNRDLVRAGWYSRTEDMLGRIVTAALST